MTVGRIFAILFFSSLAATGTTLASGIPKVASTKGGHSLPASGQASARQASARQANARQARPQVPIVMGRSVSVHRKTKLHHIKMQPLESIETPVAADNSR